MQYLIFAEVDGIYSERQGEYLAYIRFDCPPFDTLEESETCKNLYGRRI